MSEDLDANSTGQEPGSAEVGGVTDEANPLAASGDAAKNSVSGDATKISFLWPTCSHLLDSGVGIRLPRLS